MKNKNQHIDHRELTANGPKNTWAFSHLYIIACESKYSLISLIDHTISLN